MALPSQKLVHDDDIISEHLRTTVKGQKHPPPLQYKTESLIMADAKLTSVNYSVYVVEPLTHTDHGISYMIYIKISY